MRHEVVTFRAASKRTFLFGVIRPSRHLVCQPWEARRSNHADKEARTRSQFTLDPADQDRRYDRCCQQQAVDDKRVERVIAQKAQQKVDRQ